jgi:hypothetical protein
MVFCFLVLQGADWTKLRMAVGKVGLAERYQD